LNTEYGPGPHVGSAHLVAFLVDGVPLTPMERAHVMQCRACTHLMRIAASEELKQRCSTPFSAQTDERMNNPFAA
jgi:hypothetical protein